MIIQNVIEVYFQRETERRLLTSKPLSSILLFCFMFFWTEWLPQIVYHAWHASVFPARRRALLSGSSAQWQLNVSVYNTASITNNWWVAFMQAAESQQTSLNVPTQYSIFKCGRKCKGVSRCSLQHDGKARNPSHCVGEGLPSLSDPHAPPPDRCFVSRWTQLLQGHMMWRYDVTVSGRQDKLVRSAPPSCRLIIRL